MCYKARPYVRYPLYAGVSVYAKSRCRYGRLGLSGREVCSAHAASSNLLVHLQLKALQADQLALLATATVSLQLDTFFCRFEMLATCDLEELCVVVAINCLCHLFCAVRKHSDDVIPIGSISHVLFADICSYFLDIVQGTSFVLCPAAISTGVGICPDVPAGRICDSANGKLRLDPAEKHSMSNRLLSFYIANRAWVHQLAASLPVIHRLLLSCGIKISG